jgi:hypothetical protein
VACRAVPWHHATSCPGRRGDVWFFFLDNSNSIPFIHPLWFSVVASLIAGQEERQ